MQNLVKRPRARLFIKPKLRVATSFSLAKSLLDKVVNSARGKSISSPFSLDPLTTKGSFLLIFLLLPLSLQARNYLPSGFDFDYTANLDCGFVKNNALYASFGHETQIATCDKANLQLRLFSEEGNQKRRGGWLVFVDFAPLYHGVHHTEASTRHTYEIVQVGGKPYPVDGGNLHVDWYKNRGTRLYDTGSLPFLEAYVKRSFGVDFIGFSLKLGRVKNLGAFDEGETIYDDLATFSPYAYWLSKDLYTGGVAGVWIGPLALKGALFSGDGNHYKIYANCGESSPNEKSNNTPTLAFRADFDYGRLLGGRFKGSHLFAMREDGTLCSTWDDALQEGKHRRSLVNIGGDLRLALDEETTLRLFSQWTKLKSGLKQLSSQRARVPWSREITQRGYFVGGEIYLRKFAVGLTYERFGRFDERLLLLEKGRATPTPHYDYDALRHSHQNSQIYHLRYQVNDFLGFQFAYHKLHNPAPLASDILPRKSEDKFALLMRLSLQPSEK